MKSPLTKQRIQKFLSYYTPHRKIFLVDMTFAALSAASTLAFPLASGAMTAAVLAGAGADRLLPLAALLLLLTGIKMLSNIVYSYFGHAMGAKMEQTMRQELFEHYEALSFDFHAKNSTGRLMTVLSNDLNGMTELFHHAPEDLLMTAIKFAGAFICMFRLHVPLTLIVFSALPFLGAATLRADRRMEGCLLTNKRQLSEMNEYAEDSLAGIRTVKAFGQEKAHAACFARKNSAYTQGKCLYYKLEACFYESLQTYPQLLSMLVVVFGSLFIARGSLDAAALVTFLLYAGSLAEPIRTLLNFLRLYEQGKTGFVRFMDMMELCPAVSEKPDPLRPDVIQGDIRFENVSFCYPGADTPVLEGVSFEIQRGQTVALAGVSGIGKTTIASLIARFYDVGGGSVRLDGMDIRDISLQALRQNIGIVQQEVYIFNGTIRDNIRYGCPDATEEQIVAAAKLANIHDFITSLEKGYDSLVGTRGILLSGGQRQRISIARLFLRDPKILIMDEATSALDYESEKIIQQSLETLKRDRTSIFIAHRLSTIKNADRIFVISHKHITEQGTHKELLAQGGEYARLCRMGSL